MNPPPPPCRIGLKDLEIIDKDFLKARTRGCTTKDGLQATQGVSSSPESRILQDLLGKSLGLSPNSSIYQDLLGESSGLDNPEGSEKFKLNAVTQTDVNVRP